MNKFSVTKNNSEIVLKICTIDGNIFHHFSCEKMFNKYLSKCIGKNFCDVVNLALG